MKLPTLNWRHVNEGLPKYSGIVAVYALVNIGSPHQYYCYTHVKREPDLSADWTDLYGDVIDPNSMKIIYWLQVD